MIISMVLDRAPARSGDSEWAVKYAGLDDFFTEIKPTIGFPCRDELPVDTQIAPVSSA